LSADQHNVNSVFINNVYGLSVQQTRTTQSLKSSQIS